MKIRSTVRGESDWPIFMYGPAGTGKSCAAVCLMKHCDGVALYFTASGFADKIIQAMNGRLEWSHVGRSVTLWPDHIWKYVRSCALLVIDEVGARQTVSDARYEQLLRCLDCRVGKPMIVISNSGPKEIATCYDDRIASRLMAGSPIRFDGKDRRLEL